MMDEIERLTAVYSDTREALKAELDALQAEIDALRRAAMPTIRSLVRDAQDARDDLAAAIEAAADLFERPRTRTFHGVRVGIMKGKGGIRIDDPARTVALIEKHYPDLADQLIKVTKRPIKKAIETLDARALKRIGAEIEDATDQIVIKPTDSEVDKLVAALLEEEDLA